MRKLLNRKSIAFAGLAVLAVALLLFSRGGDSASATHGTPAVPPAPFVNNYSVGLGAPLAAFPVVIGANSGPAGAPQNLFQFASQNIFDAAGAFPPLSTPRFGGNLPSSGMFFTPADWTVVPGVLLPDGMPVGGTFTAVTLGFTNGPCITSVPVAATAIDATTDTTNTIVAAPNFTNLIVDVTDGAGGGPNGVPDGADFYTDILASAIPPAIVGDPFQHSYVQLPNFLGTTTNVVADIVTYAPDQLVPLGIPAGKGWATVVIVQNFNPLLPPTPSLITDQCGWETSLITAAGLRVNPATPGTKLFFALAQSRLDADNDGFDNDQDRCPYTQDPPWPVGVFGPFSPTFPLDPDFNGIPVSCDPGTPPLAPGLDADLDSFPNAQDNCAQVSNILQTESEPALLSVPSQTGPSSDAIGDACDANPNVADGHFHTVEALVAICITGGGVSDSDGDGWCDPDEDSLGSDKNDPASTPEHISIQGTCSDGKDNDIDTDTDLADSGCQLEDHDLVLKRVAGARSVCTATNTTGVGGYTIQIKNNTGAAETAEIGISVDAVAGTGGSGAEVTSVSGVNSDSIRSRPLNVDGDTDLEWETKATVDVSANGTTVVTFKVTYPACGAGSDTGGPDYVVSVDLCHGDDIPPLALFGASSPWTCKGTADGGQDRVNTANDTPLTVLVNDKSK